MLEELRQPSRKRKSLSREWVKTSFPLTAPSSWRGTIVCIDDCPNCPLYMKGCAGGKTSKGEPKGCNRWNDLVCNNCPCLGSKYAEVFGEPLTVDPKTNMDVDPSPVLARIRELRSKVEDGVKVNVSNS